MGRGEEVTRNGERGGGAHAALAVDEPEAWGGVDSGRARDGGDASQSLQRFRKGKIDLPSVCDLQQLNTACAHNEETTRVLQPHDLGDRTVAAHPRRRKHVALVVGLDLGDKRLVVPAQLRQTGKIGVGVMWGVGGGGMAGDDAHKNGAFGGADAKIVGGGQAHAGHRLLHLNHRDEARHVAIQPRNAIIVICTHFSIAVRLSLWKRSTNALSKGL
jgi:hypothetical protein